MPLRLPSMEDYGYLGQIPVRQTEPEIDAPMPLDEYQRMMGDYQPPRMPDVVRARFGAGDKQMVGSLLRAANGEESGLTGVSPTYAADILTRMGYPTTMDAWTADQWQQAIDANALKPNPLAMLGMY